MVTHNPQRDASAANQECGVRLAALANEVLTRAKAHVGCTSGGELDLVVIEGVEEWEFTQEPAKSSVVRVLRDELLIPIADLPCGSQPPLSVMSMPTGHHVMQRPQPTHPELPN